MYSPTGISYKSSTFLSGASPLVVSCFSESLCRAGAAGAVGSAAGGVAGGSGATGVAGGVGVAGVTGVAGAAGAAGAAGVTGVAGAGAGVAGGEARGGEASPLSAGEGGATHTHTHAGTHVCKHYDYTIHIRYVF